LSIGRSAGGTEWLNLPDLHQTSYLAATLPGDETLFARLGTKVRGVWRYRDATFVAVPAAARLMYPEEGATIPAAATFWWSYVPEASAYRLEIGTAPGAANVFTSGDQLD